MACVARRSRSKPPPTFACPPSVPDMAADRLAGRGRTRAGVVARLSGVDGVGGKSWESSRDPPRGPRTARREGNRRKTEPMDRQRAKEQEDRRAAVGGPASGCGRGGGRELAVEPVTMLMQGASSGEAKESKGREAAVRARILATESSARCAQCAFQEVLAPPHTGTWRRPQLLDSWAQLWPRRSRFGEAPLEVLLGGDWGLMV